MKNTKKIVITAFFVALGVVLPVMFHSIHNFGGIFCPMHLPVLMCALICGWQYGLVCGALCPLLSSLMTGMPPFAIMPFMIIELCTYGLVSGLVMKKINTKKIYVDLYVSLISAMLIGRVVNGIAKAVFLTNGYSISVWLTANFVTCLPAIILQLIIIPNLIMVLIKAKAIPNKYSLK